MSEWTTVEKGPEGGWHSHHVIDGTPVKEGEVLKVNADGKLYEGPTVVFKKWLGGNWSGSGTYYAVNTGTEQTPILIPLKIGMAVRRIKEATDE